MLDQSLTQIAQALRNSTISSTELTQIALRKAADNAHLNAFISLNETQALADARAADAALAAGNTDPLCGIVTAHKDIFCSKDILTSCGSKILSNFISPYTATVIEKTAARHMVSIGKTNMDEFAMGSTTESSFYGPTLNPWNTGHVPGGSSGGISGGFFLSWEPIDTVLSYFVPDASPNSPRMGRIMLSEARTRIVKFPPFLSLATWVFPGPTLKVRPAVTP